MTNKKLLKKALKNFERINKQRIIYHEEHVNVPGIICQDCRVIAREDALIHMYPSIAKGWTDQKI